MFRLVPRPHNVNKSSLWHGYWQAPAGDSWWWLVGTSLAIRARVAHRWFTGACCRQLRTKRNHRKEKMIWPWNGQQCYFAQICQSVKTNWLVNNVLVETFRLYWQARATDFKAVPGISTHCWVQMAARSCKSFRSQTFLHSLFMFTERVGPRICLFELRWLYKGMLRSL